MNINMNGKAIRNVLPAPSGLTLVKTLFVTACLALGAPVPAPAAPTTLAALRTVPGSYVVQAPTFELAVKAVKNSGGTIMQELRIINAVVAQLSALQDDRRMNLAPNGSANVT